MSEDIKFHFDDVFQLGIFELMMLDSTFCYKAVSFLKPEYFKNKYYCWFFETISRLSQEDGGAPSHTQISNEINRFSPEKQLQYLPMFKRITKPQMQRDHNYIRRNLEEFVRKAMRFQLNDILVKSQNRESEYVDGLIRDKFTEYSNVNFGNAVCQSVANIETVLEQSSEDSQNLIPTYMPNIDRALGGGVPKNTLTLGLSGTNVGKSIWLVNWAYHLIKNGHKVFYVNLEGYHHQTMLRLTSRAIGVSYNKLRTNDLTAIEKKKMLSFSEKYADSIQIFHDSTFGFSLEDLIPIARQKKEEFDFDIMIVDYAQILRTKQPFKEIRHQQAFIHRSLSSLSSKEDLDCAMITVAQGNRETQNKNDKGSSLIRMGDISECFEIVRAAAQVFSLNRSETDISMDTARVLLDKSRDGRTGVVEVMKTNFARMAFYGPAEEGLGFMEMNDYVHQAAAGKIK